MRVAIAISALAAVGCNQIYGLEKTSVWDGATDANLRTIEIHRRSVTTDSLGMATAPVNAPLEDLETFHAGPIGAPLEGEPEPAAGAEVISIPDALFQASWRIVLARANQVPHEYQFPPFAEGINLSFPRLSRSDRAPIPGTAGEGAGVSVQPPNYMAVWQTEHEVHRLYTTGIWSSTDVTVNPSFQAFFACPANAPNCRKITFLDDSPAAPEIAKGDRYLAIDLDHFQGNPECIHSVGAAGFQVDLAAGTIARPEPQPSWKIDNIQDVSIDGVLELATRTSELVSPDPSFVRYRVGYVPTTALSTFTNAPAPRFNLPSPPMLELLSCGLGSAPPVYVPDDLESRFPLLAHGEAVQVQTLASGVELVSGIAATTATNATSISAELDGKAVFAQNIAVGGVALPFRGVGVPVSRAALTTLTFDQPSADAQYWEIHLHELLGSTKQLRRIYTLPNAMPAAPVAVDLRAITLAPGSEYVFEIRSYTGRPAAAMGNFEPTDVRQSLAVVHSATFVVE